MSQHLGFSRSGGMYNPSLGYAGSGAAYPVYPTSTFGPVYSSNPGDPSAGNLPYPVLPGTTSSMYPSSSVPGYPQSSAGYPSASAPGYPPASAPSYPAASGPGYPPASAPGYPPASAPSYPPASAPGYPPASGPGYPPASAPGYPPASAPGYPPASAPGYPPASAPGYPPASAPSYPQSAPNYPPASASGYSQASAPGYPPSTAPGYPPTPAPGYVHASAPGYPPTPASAHYPSAGTPYGSQAAPHASHAYVEQPTIRFMHVDPSTDAAMLRKAMKGFGTDEASIINILANRTSEQRQRIILSYQQAYGKHLIKDLQSELSGDFERVVLAMLTPTATVLAQHLHEAMQGLGTNENTLVEILCTRNNREIQEIKAAYQHKYRRPLQQDVTRDTSGHFGRLMVSMCTGARDEANTNLQLAPQLAQQLYKAGEGRVGTNESEFNRILSSYSYPLLRAVFQEYHKIKGKSLHDAIKSEFSGDIKNGLLAVVMSIENRPQFFAKCLHDAMKGMGTRDKVLIRLVVTRAEVDLGNIKHEYHRMYGRPLGKDIRDDTSGDYKKMLLALAKE